MARSISAPATQTQGAPHHSTIAADSAARGNAATDLVGILLAFPHTVSVLEDGPGADLTQAHFKADSPESVIFETIRLCAGAGIAAHSEHIESIVTKQARHNQNAARAAANFSDISGYLPPQITETNARQVAAELAAILTYKPPKKKRFNFLSYDDLMELPDPEFLIHGFLIVGGTSLMTAKHASFKSFIALDMAMCVATGRAWHGYKVKQGRVIYVAAEGATGTKKRAAAWRNYHEVEKPVNFITLNRPFQPTDEIERHAFIEEIAELEPVLIVIDTMARCAVGLEENSTKEMGLFADAIGEIAAATGAHVLLVHHNNKGGDYRGSSAVPGAIDTHISLERQQDTDVLTLKTDKQKDFDELPPLRFDKVEVAVPEIKGNQSSLVFELRTNERLSRFSLTNSEQKVFDELVCAFGSEGATASAWGKVCEDAGINERTFRRAQERLYNLKLVLCPNKGQRGAVFAPNPDWGQGDI